MDPEVSLDHNNNTQITDCMGTFPKAVKRFFDVLCALVCLLLFSPLFLLCFVLVKLEDGGPVIYSQERIGRNGTPFFIHKFRSMRTDAEKAGPQLCSADISEDNRLTKVGKFLRGHHLDELPQFWNVLVGDMSFVGPRPERKFFIDQIMQHDARYELLYQIRPGISSYATIYNGYTDTMEKMLKRLEYDLYYLQHRSLMLDVRIILLTFYKIVTGRVF